MEFRCTGALVAIATPNLDRLVPFYRDLLGQSPVVHQPQVYAEFRLPELRLGLFQPQPERWGTFAAENSGSISLCLEVDHLALAMQRLAQLGYPPVGDIMTASHGQEVYSYDPDGNRLILHQPRR